MPEKSITDAPRPVRELFQKGKDAVQRNNLDYAIALFLQILHKEPAYLECREMLRAAQVMKKGTRSNLFKKMLNTAGSSPLITKGQVVLRKNPAEAMHLAEQILSADPISTAGHKLLADAALAADLPKTAVASLEILRKAAPKDKEIGMELAQAYRLTGQFAQGEAIVTDLVRIYPQDANLPMNLKNYQASRTLHEQGYAALADGSGSYRDILKDKKESETLEQEHRVHKSEDVIRNLIQEYEQRMAQEPGNLKLLRDIAELYRQKQDFDLALVYYQRIMDKEGEIDATLQRAVSETILHKLAQQMSQLDPAAPGYAAERARLGRERDEFELKEAQRLVEKYPTDLQLRFDMGELYFRLGRVSEAIREFQVAQNNPHRRIGAMRFLGQCFSQRGMNDLAANTFTTAIKEKQVMDDERKELIYLLGITFEKMGRREEAIEQFKQIYQMDSGYRDVEAKVEAYYTRGQG